MSDNAAAVERFLATMPAFRHLGFAVVRAEPGAVELEVAFREELSFAPSTFPAVIAGSLAEFAGGAACSTVAAPGTSATTIAYTISIVAPTAGDKLIARGRVVRAGTTVSVGAADVYAVRRGAETLCATALVTMRNLAPR